MHKLTLDLESLNIETFATAPELGTEFLTLGEELISRKSCIEQCTTSCVP
ncbi:MAG: hypothetical protein JWM27_4708 [Gemmatimonadetes bacterium]|nr:hypothetical protein [Gemmatimonadota bacterium]